VNARLRAAFAAYAKARRALDENAIADVAAGIDYETPTFLRLNHAVIEAEAALPWWGWVVTWWIDAKILRELDYWNKVP
jgi:hypothetical protein